jgi:hypothetical protein
MTSIANLLRVWNGGINHPLWDRWGHFTGGKDLLDSWNDTAEESFLSE